MHIHDFHTKLTSAHEGGALLEALRSLSRIEDPKAMFNADDDGVVIMGEWIAWPPMDAHASSAAATSL